MKHNIEDDHRVTKRRDESMRMFFMNTAHSCVFDNTASAQETEKEKKHRIYEYININPSKKITAEYIYIYLKKN